MSARFPAFVGVVLAALSGNAQLSSQQTNVMGFQTFEQSGKGLFSAGNSIRESGMIITPLSAEGLANDFVAWKTNDSYYRGSTALANNNSFGTTVLSRTNGAVFDFLGIDLAGFQAFNHGTVTFYAFRGFDCVASDSFTYAPGNLQTFRTSRLTNVTEIRWDQNTAATPQFDNVTVVFDATLPMAQPVIRLKHAAVDILDVAGLMVNGSYALESASDPANWIRVRTFSSSSTINFPGLILAPAPANRFYRVRSL
jgi:hypothetical protein